MFHSIIDYNDVFFANNQSSKILPRSSNPYDYIRTGYFLDNANLYGGHSNVSFNCDCSSLATGSLSNITDK